MMDLTDQKFHKRVKAEKGLISYWGKQIDFHLLFRDRIIAANGEPEYDRLSSSYLIALSSALNRLHRLVTDHKPDNQWSEVADLLNESKVSQYLIKKHGVELFEFHLSQAKKLQNQPS